jgi:hypothetical protein
MTQAQETKATEAVAHWVTEARTALGLSRIQVEHLVESAGGNRGSVWRNEQGRATAAELTRLTIVMRQALAELKQRGELAEKLLITTAVPPATVELAAAKVAEPKPAPKTTAPTAIAESTPTEAEITERLTGMTVAQLKSLAAKSGLSTATKLTKKAELVAALTKATANALAAKNAAPAKPATPRKATPKVTAK